MEEKEIIKIVISDFNEYIRIAEKKMAKPFIKDSKKKLPKKYQTDEFKWNNKGQLVYSTTGSIVPSNSMTVGQPRDWKINGQDIYNQKVKHSARASIMQKMHGKFRRHLEKLEQIHPELFPLTLRINFFIEDETKKEGRSKNIDNDNRWIYHKVIQDTLVELKKLPDDEPHIINGNYHKTYFVENPEEVKLEIILLQDD